MLIETFRHSGTTVVLVVDEHGQTAGVVTLTDVLEAVVGQVPRPDRTRAARVVEHPDGTFLIDGGVAMAEVRDRLGTPDGNPAADATYVTRYRSACSAGPSTPLRRSPDSPPARERFPRKPGRRR
jgi:CBS domain containing-hemolysin-like protein